jgi:hypothetical protein
MKLKMPASATGMGTSRAKQPPDHARASDNKNSASSGNRQKRQRRQTRIGFADMRPDDPSREA